MLSIWLNSFLFNFLLLFLTAILICFFELLPNIKDEILAIHPKIDDKVVSIKLKECLNVLKKLNKGNVVNEKQLITMMRFYSLLDEVNAAVNKA